MPKKGQSWSKHEDLTGKKISRWTVIRKELRPGPHKRKDGSQGLQTMYLCQCVCGNTKYVAPNSLRNGDSKSCGCLRAEIKSASHIVGHRFGEITALERTDRKKGSRFLYRCLCHVCGREFLAPAYSVTSSKVRSCGCIPKGAILKPGEAGFNLLLYEYRTGARKRNLEFSLSEREFRKLTEGNCFYCGREPSQIKTFSHAKTNYSNYVYNGIDRSDNTLGYTVENCVSCCVRCNSAKGKLTVCEFLELANRITSLHPDAAQLIAAEP